LNEHCRNRNHDRNDNLKKLMIENERSRHHTLLWKTMKKAKIKKWSGNQIWGQEVGSA